jgi:hypothetical protein
VVLLIPLKDYPEAEDIEKTNKLYVCKRQLILLLFLYAHLDFRGGCRGGVAKISNNAA